MQIVLMILTVLGLAAFEIICSIDNAVINAEVLGTMSQRARRWFLTWGLFFAVFLLRGLLPFFIVYFALPGMTPWEAITSTFSNNPETVHAIEKTAPILLLGGGVFLLFLFFHWLFVEPKNYGLRGERFFHKQGAWFFAVASILLAAVVWESINIDPILAFSAVLGSSAFFITHGFKQYAEEKEKKLMSGTVSDISKILYLEVIDATFSIDGVIGAFAFTLSVPLILLGNGIGAILLRQITVGNIERIKKYKYLKNGAMYSILILGVVMTAHGFGVHTPSWVSPISTFLIIGYFAWKK